jgi:hypothetical protein
MINDWCFTVVIVFNRLDSRGRRLVVVPVGHGKKFQLQWKLLNVIMVNIIMVNAIMVNVIMVNVIRCLL